MSLVMLSPSKIPVEGQQNDPSKNPLRLLPSGPDRVGEEPVHRRPSAPHIAWQRPAGKSVTETQAPA